jgi:hypothetical protein
LAAKLSLLVEVPWAASFAMQLALCGILVILRNVRRLPFFTAYICLNVAQGLFLYAIYQHYGQYSHAAFLAGWSSETITLLARLLATVEILHLVLIPYRGIWGLAWRLVAGTSVVVLICVVATSQEDPQLAVMRADRGFNLIFAAALISCLALIRYYSIRIESAYKSLLVGFCFYSCVKILLDTVLYDFLYHQHLQYTSLWQILSVSPYLLVLLFWMVALAHPLPARREQYSVLPTSVYGRISPEINLQLQAINTQLMNFFKIEEPHQ